MTGPYMAPESGIKRHRMENDKFLTVAVNLLHRALIEKHRAEAKALFRQLLEGRAVGLTRLQMEDRSQIPVTLSLDVTEHDGRLTFGAFRASLGLLVANIVEAIKHPETLQTYTAQSDPGLVLFGVPAIAYDHGHVSVLALGARSSSDHPQLDLRLMYLPPDQFLDRPAGEDAARV